VRDGRAALLCDAVAIVPEKAGEIGVAAPRAGAPACSCAAPSAPTASPRASARTSTSRAGTPACPPRLRRTRKRHRRATHKIGRRGEARRRRRIDGDGMGGAGGLPAGMDGKRDGVIADRRVDGLGRGDRGGVAVAEIPAIGGVAGGTINVCVELNDEGTAAPGYIGRKIHGQLGDAGVSNT